MKHSRPFLGLLAYLAVALATPWVAKCDPAAQATAPQRQSSVFTIEAELADAHGNPPTSLDTLLYNKGGPLGPCNPPAPILGPDGHQVTLGEWRQAGGTASVKCLGEETHVVIHFTGLIPKGLYTVDVATFKTPGFDGSLANLIGVGALGPNDGSENTVVASANGEAELSVMHPAGPLSLFGEVGDCLLDQVAFQLVGIYHLDGMSHAPVPGSPCDFVDAFAWTFGP
jgi:hypothetical protein